MVADSQEGNKPQEPQKKDFDFSRNAFPGNIVKRSGDPFKTEASARTMIHKLGLNPGTHRVVRIVGEVGSEEEGYGIELPAAEDDIPVPVYKETYKMVRFQAKSNDNDPEDVVLAVNGEQLIIRRECEVILPGRFLECADHARFPKFIQTPNVPRKVVSTIHKYPYSVIGDATKREYDTQRLAGTQKVKDNIKRFGYGVAPEDLGDDGR